MNKNYYAGAYYDIKLNKIVLNIYRIYLTRLILHKEPRVY